MALILCKEPGRLILFRTAKGSADLPARHVPFSKACANLAATKVAHALMVDVRRPHVLPHMHANFLHEYMQKITDWHELEQGLRSADSTGLVQDCHDCQHGRLA